MLLQIFSMVETSDKFIGVLLLIHKNQPGTIAAAGLLLLFIAVLFLTEKQKNMAGNEAPTSNTLPDHV
jgi:hypothetical protein